MKTSSDGGRPGLDDFVDLEAKLRMFPGRRTSDDVLDAEILEAVPVDVRPESSTLSFFAVLARLKSEISNARSSRVVDCGTGPNTRDFEGLAGREG